MCKLTFMKDLFGIVVSTSDCHPRGSGFDSRLYPRNFSGSIGSGTGSTQPRADNWVAIWMRSSDIRLRKLKLRLRDKCFVNHKAPCTAIWQQPLQSVLALRGCSTTDLIYTKYWILWVQIRKLTFMKESLHINNQSKYLILYFKLMLPIIIFPYNIISLLGCHLFKSWQWFKNITFVTWKIIRHDVTASSRTLLE